MEHRPNRPSGRGYGRPRPGGRRPGGPPRQKRKPDVPMLAGEPSPSLAKINLMRASELEAKINQLVTEQGLLEKRITNLGNAKPPDEEKIERNKKQLERLKAIEEVARERLAKQIDSQGA